MQAKNNCMKKILFIISIIFFQCSIYAQDYIKSDSLKIDGKLYKMKHLSFGSSSGLKLFKVMTCEALNLKKIEQEIINCHRNHKLEFTEFYVISIPTYEKVSLEKETNILVSFLDLIDAERMSLKLSTALIKSKFKIDNFTHDYFLNQPKNDLSDFKDYKLNIKAKDVCIFLRK